MEQRGNRRAGTPNVSVLSVFMEASSCRVHACEANSIRPRINAKGINDFKNIETDASKKMQERQLFWPQARLSGSALYK